jgi:hypothetical protein
MPTCSESNKAVIQTSKTASPRVNTLKNESIKILLDANKSLALNDHVFDMRRLNLDGRLVDNIPDRSYVERGVLRVLAMWKL